jgi:hypothetical protein
MILVVDSKCSHYSCVLYTKEHNKSTNFLVLSATTVQYNRGLLQEDVTVYLDFWTGRLLLKAPTLFPVTPREEKLRGRIDIIFNQSVTNAAILL